MVSFGEVVVIVTAAGLLLRRKELVPMARLLGSSIGKLVGTMQGFRMRYEKMYKGTEIFELHGNVRKGIDELRNVAYDVSALGRIRGTTYLSSGKYIIIKVAMSIYLFYIMLYVVFI